MYMTRSMAIEVVVLQTVNLKPEFLHDNSANMCALLHAKLRIESVFLPTSPSDPFVFDLFLVWHISFRT